MFAQKYKLILHSGICLPRRDQNLFCYLWLAWWGCSNFIKNSEPIEKIYQSLHTIAPGLVDSPHSTQLAWSLYRDFNRSLKCTVRDSFRSPLFIHVLPWPLTSLGGHNHINAKCVSPTYVWLFFNPGKGYKGTAHYFCTRWTVSGIYNKLLVLEVSFSA